MNGVWLSRARHAWPALAGLVLLTLALEALRVQLRAFTWLELKAAVTVISRGRLALTLILTILNYAALTGYDRLAFAYIGNALPWRRIVATSFVAYAIANNVGFPALSGAWVRYHFYTRWGVTAEELSRIVFAYSVTFWLGLLALAGTSIAFSPVPRASVFPGRCPAAVGWLLMLAGGVCRCVRASPRATPVVEAASGAAHRARRHRTTGPVLRRMEPRRGGAVRAPPFRFTVVS